MMILELNPDILSSAFLEKNDISSSIIHIGNAGIKNIKK
jgi:hypothetical protein